MMRQLSLPNPHHSSPCTKTYTSMERPTGKTRVLPLSLSLTELPPCRNRAIHRDLVAVRILAQSDCRPQANALTPSPSSSSSGGEGSGVRCGVVVGVLDRAAREYVASFAVSQLCDSCSHYMLWNSPHPRRQLRMLEVRQRRY